VLRNRESSARHDHRARRDECAGETDDDIDTGRCSASAARADLEAKTSPPQPLWAGSRPAGATSKINPAASISYGVLVFLVSVITVVGIFALNRDYILLPAFAGFMVVGPLIGIGLFTKRAGASRKAGPSACGT